ncbi:MAG: hypothetical protein K6E95_02575 [Lachnospiraceae bacterium]|nr:hypothetical protein [Lachnospiraceae bacterium]
MKKHIKVLSIVALILFVIGACLMIASYFIFYSNDIPSKIRSDHTVNVEGEIIGIDLTSSYFDVSVERGDSYKVVFEDSYEPGTKVSIKDGILRITGDYCDDIDLFDFKVSPASKLLDPLGGKVKIFFPEYKNPQLIYAEIGCGSLSIKDVSCGRLVAQVGIGSISLDNVYVPVDHFLECKLGNIYINGDMNFAINHSVSKSYK